MANIQSDPQQMTPEQLRAAQAKLKKRAVQNLIGCLCMILFAAVPIVCLSFLASLTNYSSSNALFELPLIKIENEVVGLAIALLFSVLTGAALAGAIGSKSKLLWPAALVVFVAVAVAPAWFWYRGFVLVSIRNDGMAEFRYLWPRPSVWVEAAQLDAVEAIESEEASDRNTVESNFKWVLEVEAGGARYASVPTNYASRVVKARHQLLRERALRWLGTLERADLADGPEAAELAMQLGDTCTGLEDLAAARDAYARALALLEKADGPSSLAVSRACFALGRSHHALKDYSNAEACYKRTLEIQRTAQAESDEPECIVAAMAYKALLQETGRHAEAEKIIHTPYTLLTDLTRRVGRQEAEARIKSLMEQRRKAREP